MSWSIDFMCTLALACVSSEQCNFGSMLEKSLSEIRIYCLPWDKKDIDCIRRCFDEPSTWNACEWLISSSQAIFQSNGKKVLLPKTNRCFCSDSFERKYYINRSVSHKFGSLNTKEKSNETNKHVKQLANFTACGFPLEIIRIGHFTWNSY